MSLVLRNVRSLANRQNQQKAGPWGILNFPVMRDVFPDRLARGIPLKQGHP